MDIPFFPIYEFEDKNNVSLWWFERKFSQAEYGENSKFGSNSCTLITILTAEKIAQFQVKTAAKSNNLPRHVVETFAKAILDGNIHYRRLYLEHKLNSVNLNIPEAMDALKVTLKRLEEWFYVQTDIAFEENYEQLASDKLFNVLSDGLDMWTMVYDNHEYLFVVMIANSRSIVLCFQNSSKTSTLFDSHTHGSRRGALIAQVAWNNLLQMCEWIVNMFVQVYKERPKLFELSFIPTKKGS